MPGPSRDDPDAGPRAGGSGTTALSRYEADGPEEESTRGTLPLGDSPSEPEYVPSLNEPSEADGLKEESLRGTLPLEDFPLCRFAGRLRLDDTH